MRRFRTRRRFSRKLARQRVAWGRGTFNDTMPTDNSLIEFTIIDPASVSPELAAGQNAPLKVRRIIIHGNTMFYPDNNVTPVIVTSGALHAVMYVIDREDTDSNIASGAAGFILATQRVLWMKSAPLIWHSSAYANGGHPTVTSETSMDIDIDWKGQVKLRADELIVLGFQTESYSTTVDAAVPRFAAGVAVLYEPL